MSQDKMIAMIPARLGSQRLKRKNLALLNGQPLIAHAIRKCFAAQCFDEVWVNSESDEIAEVAIKEGAKFHRRPATLADNVATSEEFVEEFLLKHPCEALFQVHSIAPLLTFEELRGFTQEYKIKKYDVLLSCIRDQIEIAFQDQPVNFTFAEKSNSQDLIAVQRITWSVSAWRRKTFLDARKEGRTATYFGRVGFFDVGQTSGHVIKTQQDLEIAEALLAIQNKKTHCVETVL
ncbi:cytidyltransferase [Pseudovibrio sp. Ad26]|uniref:acylneuraminate cytidylyltransferase family protein n=1 Tax=Pseudovibrio sp. Ad26 TaxID=989410 RepID=UPI0007AEDDD3|nr:cytidyltransferase [Pseudovibrio sp. Ad26]KZL16324.1 CMP-N,N'-diacetyllegionaminic acid synthase [Pseudovibrio sp. Ad26]